MARENVCESFCWRSFFIFLCFFCEKDCTKKSQSTLHTKIQKKYQTQAHCALHISCKWLQTTPTNAYAINAQTNAKNTHKRTALLGFFRWVPKGSRTFRRPTAKKAETRKSVHFCCFLRAHSVPHTLSFFQTTRLIICQ